MNFFYQSRVESFSSFLSNDNTYPAHLHRQVEIMYVLSGELEISVEQQVYYLHKDDISVTFPDKIHSLNTPESSQVLLWYLTSISYRIFALLSQNVSL